MQTTFTNRQISFVLFGAIIGYGVMGMPKTMVEAAGTGCWISIAIGTLVAALVVLGLTYLNYVHKGKTICEYSEELTGKTVSVIIRCIYVLFFFVLLTLVIRLSSEIVKYTILLKTPIWAISLALTLLTVYTLMKGIKTIVRICVFLGVVVLFVALASHIVVSTQGEWINLQPIMGSEPFMAYVKGAAKTALPFFGIELLLVVPFGKDNNKKVFLYTTLTVIAIGLFYIFVVYSCLSVMGEGSIVYYRDAVLATIRRVKFEQLEFLKRLDGIAIVAWIFAVYCSVCLLAYGASKMIGSMIKKPHHNLTVLIVGALAYIAGVSINSYEFAIKLFEYCSYAGIATAFAIPLMLIIMTKVKGYDKKTA